jgi:hypothetical protein
MLHSTLLIKNYPVFPVRYYIIDFEYSIRSPEDSPSDQRVMTGLPGDAICYVPLRFQIQHLSIGKGLFLIFPRKLS